jgi:peptidoglycan/LPS O-acetylase OafA/YrhL
MVGIVRKPFKREIELDFIRGVAIIAVVDFHSQHQAFLLPLMRLGWPHFGWAGVNLFFILSGFLVGGLLVKEWKVRGRIDGRQFLIRRSFKIWPQYYVFILAMLVTRHRTLHQLWGNIFNVQNYVGGIAHTWSLAVEEHAYLFLVLVLAIAARRQTRMRNLFLFLGVLCIGVFTLTFVLASHHIDTFLTTHTRIDGILYGVMLAILYHYAPETFVRLQRLTWLWIAIIVATIVYFRFDPRTYWGHPLAVELANAMSIGLMLLLYRHYEGKPHTVFYRFIAWIGLYSYGIYLWHVSVVALALSLERHFPRWAVPAWEWVGVPVLGILVGIFFTKLVEFPALKLRERLYPRRVDSAVGTPAEIEVHELASTGPS